MELPGAMVAGMKRGKKRHGKRRHKVAQCMRVECMEVTMGPEIHAMQIPETLHLERRHVCQPTSDEPVMLRDDNGHVYAVVDAAPESLRPAAN